MNLNFKAKVFLGQLFILLFFLLFTGIVLYLANDVRNQKMAMIESSFAKYKISERIKYDVVQIQQWVTDLSATRGEDGLDDGLKKAEESYNDLLSSVAKLKLISKEGETKSAVILDEIKLLADAYYSAGLKMADLYAKNGTRAGNTFMPTFDKASEDLQVKLSPLLLRSEELLSKNIENTKNRAGLILNLAIWIPVTTLIAFALFSYFFINRLDKSLKEVVSGLIENSSDLEGASLSLYENSMQLSSTVTEQSSAIELSVSAIHEISSTVDSNADFSANARDAAEESANTTRSGIETLGGVLVAIEDMSKNNIQIIQDMKEVNTEVEEIIKIISDIENKTKIINDIVFQTKLLSFNASVEAARAGEHGKGFSVVAEEVGKLAAMSGKAAKEISQMLDHGVAKVKTIVEKSKEKVVISTSAGARGVETSKRVVEDARLVMDSILDNIEKVKTMNNEIALASTEQSAGVRGVNRSFSDINISIKNNADVADESSEQAKVLKDQSEKLSVIINNFLLFIEGKKENSFDFKTAISAHLGWRSKLNNYLVNPDGSLKPDVVCRDNQCALGKWIYGDGKIYTEKHLETYRSLVVSHAEFHKCAGHIVELVNSGNVQEAIAELRPKSTYIQVSKNTVGLIKKLQAEILHT